MCSQNASGFSPVYPHEALCSAQGFFLFLQLSGLHTVFPRGHAVDLLKLPVKECPVAAADLFHDLADGAFGVRQQKRRLRELLAVLQLRAINAEYIRRLSPEEFQKKAEPWIDKAVHTSIDKKLLCANLQPRCEVLGEIPEQLDFFDAMPEYDVSMYANKKQKTTPETAKEALEALLPVLSDEALDFGNRDAVFDACKAKAEELGKKNGWLLYPLGIALSGKQRTPGGGTDLACMMGRETTLARVKAAIEKLNGCFLP